MADDAPIATRWHMLLIGAATTVLTTFGSYVSSHWGGVTSEQLKAVKDDVVAVATKQQSGDEVNARNHAETKAQLAKVDAKVDKLSAAVLGRKKKRSDAEP
jgi:hypothetical protein